MAGTDEMALLRVYSGERAHGKDHPLYQELVTRARQAGLAGATVLRGPLGYGRSGTVQDADLVDTGAELPTVVEIVDQEARLLAFAESYPELANAGLVTLERLEILHRPARQRQAALDSAS